MDTRNLLLQHSEECCILRHNNDASYNRKKFYKFLNVLIQLIQYGSSKATRQIQSHRSIRSTNDANNNSVARDMTSISNNNHHVLLLRQIKLIVQQCIIQHRLLMQLNYEKIPSLQDTITLHIHNIFGIEYYWNKTRDYIGYDCSV